MAFVDYRSGQGVLDTGGPLPVTMAPRRGRMPLRSLLTTAREAGVRRLLLTGPRPAERWLEEDPGPGWRPDPAGHYYDADDPCGRFLGPLGERVELRRAAAWFGNGDYTPTQAREAMALFVTALRQAGRSDDVALMASPAATGQSLWAASLPPGWEGEQLPADVAHLIRKSSPQHRMEVFGHCYDDCPEHLRPPRGKLPALHYYDGRLMYLACTRELATAPAQLLTRAECFDLFRETPHARGRLYVKYTVPDGWDLPGLLMEPHPDGRHWHAPNRPGYTGWTWADTVEVWFAMTMGWRIDFDSGYTFTGRPVLDLWTDRVLAMRDALDAADTDDGHRVLAKAAVRMMALTTIGSFHSTGRDRTVVADGPAHIPDGVTHWETRADGSVVYRAPATLTGNAAAMARPELSAQVWARARYKVTAHMARLPREQLVAVWGDALYVTEPPGDWSGWTPDDGKPGRLRSKGTLDGPLPRPLGLSGLLKLRDRMVV